jgi:hypothetical protein
MLVCLNNILCCCVWSKLDLFTPRLNRIAFSFYTAFKVEATYTLVKQFELKYFIPRSMETTLDALLETCIAFL